MQAVGTLLQQDADCTLKCVETRPFPRPHRSAVGRVAVMTITVSVRRRPTHRHDRHCRKLGRQRVRLLRLDGGRNVEIVDELHEAVELSLLGGHLARVEELQEGLHQHHLHVGQDQEEGLVGTAAGGGGIAEVGDEGSEEGGGGGQHQTVGRHHAVVTLDVEINKLLNKECISKKEKGLRGCVMSVLRLTAEVNKIFIIQSHR